MPSSKTATRPGATVRAYRARLLACATCCLALLAPGRSWSQEPDTAGAGRESIREALTRTAERILLPERCGECHAAELAVWEATEHATGFDTLHRSERAKEIYRRLGLRLIKRGTDETTPSCLSCHYTPVLRRGQLRAGAGVTCESCHGAARDWVDVHNSYGVAESDFQAASRLETDAHRAQRIADSTAAGMRRPSRIYDVAASCFGCHTVPNEELVNRAGHSTGSDFELVEWSERIRHNFLESYKTADGRTNADRPRARKRIMYVVGRALDVEYSLRGVAAATRDDLYAAAMSDRVGVALDELFAINDRLEIPAIQTILAISEAADLTFGKRDALLAAADAVQTATKAFIADADGDALAALDPLWDPDVDEPAPAPGRVTDAAIPPQPDATRPGSDAPVSAPSGAAVASADEETRTEATEQGEPAAAPTAGASQPSSQPAARAPSPSAPLVTLTRPPWRQPPAHDFVKVPCGRCHSAQEKWWRRDPHSRAAAPLRNREPRALEIARAYGVASDDVARGTQICMWCHGTVVSNPSRRVRAGVGCQRCHGPGADYLEPHETVSRAESVALGLTDLPDPDVQASTCAGCHYVTDPGLVRAGHPAGADFDILARVSQIVHWGDDFGRDSLPRDSNALAEAHERVIGVRGPVPAGAPGPVRTSAPGGGATVAAGRGDAEVPASNGDAAAPASFPSAGGQGGRTVSATARPPRSGPARERARAAPDAVVVSPELGDIGVDDDSSVEEALERLRLRIRNIYRALDRLPAP